MVIYLPCKFNSKPFIIINIAISLAVYRFCSVFSPNVIEDVIASLFSILLRVLWIIPPIPTMSFFLDELVVIYMP